MDYEKMKRAMREAVRPETNRWTRYQEVLECANRVIAENTPKDGNKALAPAKFTFKAPVLGEELASGADERVLMLGHSETSMEFVATFRSERCGVILVAYRSVRGGAKQFAPASYELGHIDAFAALVIDWMRARREQLYRPGIDHEVWNA